MRLIENGPNVLCRMCGDVCNHFTGLCDFHRETGAIETGAPFVSRATLTDADRAYLAWQRERTVESR